MARRAHTLLAPGNEAAWARIAAGERRDRALAPDTPVETLLLQAEALSRQAFQLLNAVLPADESRPAPSA